MADGDLRERAEAWLAEDPDPETRAELRTLLNGGEMAAVASRFDGRLEFGTAGLRGPIGAGSNRMNRAVVMRAAAGLASYLRAHGGGSVVVGYDARHKSEEFARDTAGVMRGAGLDAYLLPGRLPTPVLAFAIRRLGCAAGVMVTASHNPARDNGYKVYLGDGAQIVPPADAAISAAIDAVQALADVPMGDDWAALGTEIIDDYVAAVAAIIGPGPRRLSMVYTPLHGVGHGIVHAVLERAGFPAPLTVAAQEQPDPDFPTTTFPNPEEPGAMDLALTLAARKSADIVVANDPDADRCAVAVPGPHGWQMLRGDEVGALLADHLLEHGRHGVYATSIVSSTLLSRMAARHGMRYAETLTGFKWIGRVPDLAFGYEEALGYCVAPSLVRDKDGISALLLVAQMAAALKAQRSTLLDRLDHIARTYGLHATDQLAVRVDEIDHVREALSRLLTGPPSRLGGLAVELVEDLSSGVAGLPPTEGIRLRLADQARVVVRPSGTEPKLKCYFEVVIDVGGGDVDAARIAAAGRLDAIRHDLARAAGLSAD